MDAKFFTLAIPLALESACAAPLEPARVPPLARRAPLPELVRPAADAPAVPHLHVLWSTRSNGTRRVTENAVADPRRVAAMSPETPLATRQDDPRTAARDTETTSTPR
jgi:hypothetical protein